MHPVILDDASLFSEECFYDSRRHAGYILRASLRVCLQEGQSLNYYAPPLPSRDLFLMKSALLSGSASTIRFIQRMRWYKGSEAVEEHGRLLLLALHNKLPFLHMSYCLGDLGETAFEALLKGIQGLIALFHLMNLLNSGLHCFHTRAH